MVEKIVVVPLGHMTDFVKSSLPQSMKKVMIRYKTKQGRMRTRTFQMGIRF